MIKHRGVAARPIDAQRDAPAAIEIARVAAQQPADMENRAVRLARIDDLEERAGCGFDHAAVANLTTAFGIKGRLGGHEEDAVIAVAMNREDLGLGVVAMVSDEARSGAGVEVCNFGRNRVVLTCGASDARAALPSGARNPRRRPR